MVWWYSILWETDVWNSLVFVINGNWLYRYDIDSRPFHNKFCRPASHMIWEPFGLIEHHRNLIMKTHENGNHQDPAIQTFLNYLFHDYFKSSKQTSIDWHKNSETHFREGNPLMKPLCFLLAKEAPNKNIPTKTQAAKPSLDPMAMPNAGSGHLSFLQRIAANVW